MTDNSYVINTDFVKESFSFFVQDEIKEPPNLKDIPAFVVFIYVRYVFDFII